MDWYEQVNVLIPTTEDYLKMNYVFLVVKFVNGQ